MNQPPTATQIDVLKVLKLLGEAYPTFQLSRTSIEVYVGLLTDLPAALLEQAALEHISRSAFFPTIAELRGAAFDLLEAAHPSISAHEAWLVVQDEIQRTGHAGQPEFTDPLLIRAVDALGWRQLCLSDNPIADRAHFVQVYQALLERRKQEQRRPLEVRRFIALQAGSPAALPENAGASMSKPSLPTL